MNIHEGMDLKVIKCHRASLVFTECHKVTCLVYSLFQHIIGDGILLSWTVHLIF